MATWIQRTITVAPKPRGFHVITPEVAAKPPELQYLRAGVCPIFIQHTSASISINERVVPEVRHDMPAHIKAMLAGSSATVNDVKAAQHCCRISTLTRRYRRAPPEHC